MGSLKVSAQTKAAVASSIPAMNKVQHILYSSLLYHVVCRQKQTMSEFCFVEVDNFKDT